MIGNLSGPTMIIILVIVLLLFGAPKLPGLAKSIGQSMKILKKEVRDDSSDQPAGPSAETPSSPDSPAKPEGPGDNKA